MPTIIKILTPDGLKPADYSADSLAAAASHEPDEGVYTVANTFNTYDTLKLDAHFDRLEDSARRENIALQLNRKVLRATLREMITESQFGDVRFRVTVPREQPDHLILTIEPFTPLPEALYETGVCCITAPDSGRSSAEAKTTDWMHARKSLDDAMPAGIYDTFLLDSEGYMLEGLGANFYAIVDAELRTAGAGVLKGISQQIVFEVAPPIIPVRKAAVHVSKIPQFSEAFLTSSSRGIVPVIEIDGIAIGTGKPGTITAQLRHAYDKWLQQNLDPL